MKVHLSKWPGNPSLMYNDYKSFNKKERRMNMKRIGWLFFWGMAFLWGTTNGVQAEIQLTDQISLAGFIRYDLAVHVGVKNPSLTNVEDNYHFNLSRTLFQPELTYKPSTKFKCFAKIRIASDQTDHLNHNYPGYDAFPMDVPKYDWTMMKKSNDDYRVEVRELYAELALPKFWLRVGKQQISWGEMIATRVTDVINSLDRSQHFIFDPEEFENIRIANWSIRAMHTIPKLFWGITDSTIEGYLTPGDIVPTIDPAFGAPFFFYNFPTFFRIKEKDNRGKMEYGVRIGGIIGIEGPYLTLDYAHVYSDDFNLKFRGWTPDPINGIPIFAPRDWTRYAMLLDAKYVELDTYGMTLNYAFGYPYNTVVTFEGVWIPNQPYAAAGSPAPMIRDQGTFNYAVRFNRTFMFLPRQFLGSSGTQISLQFYQSIREGDPDKITGPGESKMDKENEMVSLQVLQPLLYNDLNVSVLFLYDPDNCYEFKPDIKYTYGDHWSFEVMGLILGGGERRPGRLGSFYWADEVLTRINFQF